MIPRQVFAAGPTKTARSQRLIVLKGDAFDKDLAPLAAATMDRPPRERPRWQDARGVLPATFRREEPLT